MLLCSSEGTLSWRVGGRFLGRLGGRWGWGDTVADQRSRDVRS